MTDLPEAPPGPSPTPAWKPKRWPWILGIVVSLFIGIGIGAAATPEEKEQIPVAEAPATSPSVPAETSSPLPSPTPSPTPSPEPEAVSYRLERGRVHLSLKTTERQCFGSAGCLITVEVRLAVDDRSTLPRDGTWDITYGISGDESGTIIGTFQLFGNGKYEVNEETVSTASENIEPRVRVVSVERVL